MRPPRTYDEAGKVADKCSENLMEAVLAHNPLASCLFEIRARKQYHALVQYMLAAPRSLVVIGCVLDIRKNFRLLKERRAAEQFEQDLCAEHVLPEPRDVFRPS